MVQVGSVQAPRTMELIQKFGFPADKRLGAGVVDGRGVWADTGRAAALLGEVASLHKGPIAAQVSAHLAAWTSGLAWAGPVA